MSLYELIILGSPSSKQLSALTDRITEQAAEFELEVGTDLVLRTAVDVDKRDPKATTAAVYFAGVPACDLGAVRELIHSEVPVIPVAPAGKNTLEGRVPAELKATNAFFVQDSDKGTLEALSCSLLECVGLLHEQRRVFVSYRRDTSREVALQLHEQLSAHGFDVFLDTHDIRPGHPFQEMLWHRLSDCDIMIMLDTVDYYGSKWTREELGKSMLKKIQILRLIWPGNHKPNPYLQFSDAIQLSTADFTSKKRLSAAKFAEVVRRSEMLRSRSISTRQKSILGTLKAEMGAISANLGGVGKHRSVRITLSQGKSFLAYPIVGIPTADMFHDIAKKAASEDGDPILIYDHAGIRPGWLEHLDWLDTEISTIKAYRIFDIGWKLIECDS